MLTKEKEEAVKERDKVKQLSENLRKKYEIEATRNKKKKSSPVMLH